MGVDRGGQGLCLSKPNRLSPRPALWFLVPVLEGLPQEVIAAVARLDSIHLEWALHPQMGRVAAAIVDD